MKNSISERKSGGFEVFVPRNAKTFDILNYADELKEITSWMAEQFDPLTVTWRIEPFVVEDTYWKAELSEFSAACAFLLRWG